MNLGSNAGGAADSEPIVRIDYDGGELDVPVAPRPAESQPRRAAAALIIGVAAVLGLLFWLDQDLDDSVDPPEQAVEEPAADAPLQSDAGDSDPGGESGEFEPTNIEQEPIDDPIDSLREPPTVSPHLITSVAPRRMDGDQPVDEWVGVHGLDARLIRSIDGGLTWSYTNLNAGEVLAVGSDSEGATTMVMGRHEPDALTLDTWTAISSGWGRNGRWPSIDVGDGEVIHVATGEHTVVLVEDGEELVVLLATPEGRVERFALDLEALPVELDPDAVRTNGRIVTRNDGSLVLLTSGGIHRATAPYDEWVLLTEGPFGLALRGQRFGVPLFGSGFFANDPRGTGVFSATCCGDDAESVDNWSTLATGGREFSRVLIASDSVVLFQAADGEVAEVAR